MHMDISTSVATAASTTVVDTGSQTTGRNGKFRSLAIEKKCREYSRYIEMINRVEVALFRWWTAIMCYISHSSWYDSLHNFGAVSANGRNYTAAGHREECGLPAVCFYLGGRNVCCNRCGAGSLSVQRKLSFPRSVHYWGLHIKVL